MKGCSLRTLGLGVEFCSCKQVGPCLMHFLCVYTFQKHLVWNAFDGKWVKLYSTLAPAVARVARGS